MHTTTRHFDPALERLSRRELLELQWRKLADQLERLYRTNPYYAARLRQAGATPDKITCLAAFRELVPMSDKRDFLTDQAAHPPFGQRLGIPERQATQVCLTSGTSGVGQEVYGHTAEDAARAGTDFAASLRWAGLGPGDRVYHLAPVSTLAMGQVVVEGMRAGRFQPFHAFNLDSVAKLGMMRRFPPDAILLTPAHLARLSTVFAGEGVRPAEAFPGLKALLLSGQSYPVELVGRARRFWGTEVFELYGSTQGKVVAANCELGAVRDARRTGMHIHENRHLIELLDSDTGLPVAEGEEGVAVITNLDTEGSPCLRFRTDDKMRYLGADCACGRPLAMIESGSISRYDDMMKVRGMNIWPQLIDEIVLGQEMIEEYIGRVYVDDAQLEQVEIRYALAPGSQLPAADRAALTGRLVQILKERTNVTCQVIEVDRDALPVFEFKAARWTDTRRTDLQRQVW